MLNADLEHALKLIDSMVREFLNQKYFSGFYGSKDALPDLAALNFFGLNSDLALNKTELTEITEGLEKKKFAANASPFDHLQVCYKSIESLRAWQAMHGHTLEKHLLDTLSKVLNTIIFSSASEEIKAVELKKKLSIVEKHINNVEVINNFFKLLKKINQTELKDVRLESLLKVVDSDRGLIVPAEELAEAIQSLGKDVYDYLNLYVKKELGFIGVTFDEDQIKRKNFLLQIFAALAPLQFINLSEDVPFANIGIGKARDLLDNHNSREIFLAQIDSLLFEIKRCVEDKAWNSKAKNTLGAPNGICELRKIFNNVTLDPLEKLFAARKLLKKKFKRLGFRDTATSDFYDYLSRKLDILYDEVGSDYEESRKAFAKGLLFFYWKTKNYAALTKGVAEIRNEVKATVDELQNPNLSRKLMGSWHQSTVGMSLTLMTYNVQQIIGSPNQEERSEEIIDFLRRKSAGVIILQEAFQPGFLDALKKSPLARDYHIIKPKGVGILNSGVCTLLKKEKFGASENLEAIQENFSFATSVDALVPKGMTHIKISNKVKANSLHEEATPICHIVGTHTQAQYKDSPFQIVATLAQLAQLGEHISKIPKNEPILLGGDLNIVLQKLANEKNIEFSIAEYLLYPLIHQPTVGNSYDRESNLLFKTYNSAEPPVNLDFIFSRHCRVKSEAQVLVDTRYTGKNKKESNQSDHYPVTGEFEIRGKEEIESALVAEEACIVQQQKLALAELVRFAYGKATPTNKLGIWQKEVGIKMHIAVSNLIHHYAALSDEEKGNLGVGDRFIDYCLGFKLSECVSATKPNYFFDLTVKKIPVASLGELLDYKPSTSLSNALPMTSSKEEDDIFLNIHRLLVKARDVVEEREWNKKGRDIFYRESKCPNGIKAIRACVNGVDSEIINEFNPKALTPYEKVGLLKKYIALHKLVINKSNAHSSLALFKYRQKETQEVYEKIAEATKALFGFFAKSQFDVLHVIEKYNKGAEDIQIIETLKALNVVEEGNAIFNVKPIIASWRQDKFKEALASLDLLTPQAVTHHMGL